MSFLFSKILGERVVHPPYKPSGGSGDDTDGKNAPSADKVSGNDETGEDATVLMNRVRGCRTAKDLRDTLAQMSQSRKFVRTLAADDVPFFFELVRSAAEDEQTVELCFSILVHLTAHSLTESGNSHSGGHGSQAEWRRQRAAFLSAIQSEVPFLVDILRVGNASTASSGAPPSTPSVPRDVTDETSSLVTELLIRLEEHDSADVHKRLLSCHGVEVLLTALQRKQSETFAARRLQMRRELHLRVLRLLGALTATDTDMQLDVVNCNGFNILFGALRANNRDGELVEGTKAATAAVTDAADAGKTRPAENGKTAPSFGFMDFSQGTAAQATESSLAAECLTTIHNVLRGNPETQKLFLDQGHVSQLCPVLEAVPERIYQLSSAGKSLDSLNADAQKPLLLLTLSILQCLLREASSRDRSAVTSSGPSEDVTAANPRGDGGEHTRSLFTEKHVHRALCSLALCGDVVDVAVRIESLRLLTSLVKNHREGVSEVLDSVVLSIVLPSNVSSDAAKSTTSKKDTVRWPALRGIVHIILSSTDVTLVSASALLLDTMFQVKPTFRQVWNAVMDGFAPQTAIGASGAGGPSAAAGAAMRLAQLPSGGALSLVLFSPGNISCTSPNCKYYAAETLYRLFLWASSFSGGEALTDVCGMDWSKGKAATPGSGAEILPIPLTPGQPLTFLHALVAYYVYVMNGGSSLQQIDLHGLSAYTQLVLHLVVTAPASVVTPVCLAKGSTWFKTLLLVARRDGPAHTRLWCASLAAQLVLRAGDYYDSGSATSNSNGLPSLQGLVADFLHHFGPPSVFDTLMFDVERSQWGQPAQVAFTSGNAPVVYDSALVEVLRETQRVFKTRFDTLQAEGQQDARSAASPSAVPPPASSPPHTNLDSNTAASHSTIARGDADEVRRLQIALEECKRHYQQQLEQQSAAVTQLEQRVHQLQQSDESVRRELEWSRGAIAERDRIIASLEERLQSVTAELDRLQRERQQAATAASAVAADTAAVDELRSTVSLLEEALRSKEEEHQQLVSTLNQMEQQLQSLSAAAQATTTQSAASNTESLRQQQQQQQQQMEQLRTQLTSLYSEKERMQQELNTQLSTLIAEKQTLLIMVAEQDLQREQQQQQQQQQHIQSQQTFVQHQQPYGAELLPESPPSSASYPQVVVASQHGASGGPLVVSAPPTNSTSPPYVASHTVPSTVQEPPAPPQLMSVPRAGQPVSTSYPQRSTSPPLPWDAWSDPANVDSHPLPISATEGPPPIGQGTPNVIEPVTNLAASQITVPSSVGDVPVQSRDSNPLNGMEQEGEAGAAGTNDANNHFVTTGRPGDDACIVGGSDNPFGDPAYGGDQSPHWSTLAAAPYSPDSSNLAMMPNRSNTASLSPAVAPSNNAMTTVQDWLQHSSQEHAENERPHGAEQSSSRAAASGASPIPPPVAHFDDGGKAVGTGRIAASQLAPHTAGTPPNTNPEENPFGAPPAADIEGWQQPQQEPQNVSSVEVPPYAAGADDNVHGHFSTKTGSAGPVVVVQEHALGGQYDASAFLTQSPPAETLHLYGAHPALPTTHNEPAAATSGEAVGAPNPFATFAEPSGSVPDDDFFSIQ